MPSQTPPYKSSLLGEYAKLILFACVLPLVIWFAFFLVKHQSGVVCLISSLALLGTLVTTRGNPLFRIVFLAAMTVNVFSFAINPNEAIGDTRVLPPDFSVYALLFCLLLALIFEIRGWVSSSSRTVLLKTVGWGLLLIPAAIYVLGFPLFELVWNWIEADETKLARSDPNWNFVNEAAFRGAKFAVFCAFAYLAACLGSFLNVAADCIPRGKAIGLRDSKCPKCDTKLSRIDNLPIFSYVNLGAKCRSCKVAIPARYLIVELVVAAIFGSLFLYELVTGCQNVPFLKISHQGILWVILYPKWPAIAIYLYHSFFMCAVLVLALMEWDKHPLKLGFAAFLLIVFFAAGICYMTNQPVPLLAHLPGVSFEMNEWVERALKLIIGGVLGALTGSVLGRFFLAKRRAILTFSLMLTGMVLGWQALFQVVVVFALVSTATRFVPAFQRLFGRPTTLLLVAIALHQPFWQTIASWWNFN